ncbi:MAG: DEAD/DEAH box helicase [Bacteroidales bacterium]|nr:MAG: DEAD/DEAH box helicase [Bacteroidales bacterium]
MTFRDFNFNKEIYKGLEAMGFKEPTPIQELAIPAILEGRDLIGCAQTGTGKTAAYILPLLNRILEIKEKPGPISTMVIAPTRELALQIDQQFEGFSYYVPVSSIPVYGGGDGLDWDIQKSAMVKGTDVLIATPGRLIAHLKLEYLRLEKVRFLVLDEADRMLDMGFYDDIMHIITSLPVRRQNLLFSATMPPEIRRLAKEILVDPVEINISLSKPADGILQTVYFIDESLKTKLLIKLLAGKEIPSILVFCSTKVSVRNLERKLISMGYLARAIHSDLPQKERENVLLDFRNRKIRILVATDVVSRGIDIEGIDLIVNYDVPQDAEDYVHRVGRTARASSTGVAITLVKDGERNTIRKIEKLIGYEIFKSPVPPEILQGHRRGIDRT